MPGQHSSDCCSANDRGSSAPDSTTTKQHWETEADDKLKTDAVYNTEDEADCDTNVDSSSIHSEDVDGVSSDLLYPGFADVVFYCLPQTHKLRLACLHIITSPYPFLTSVWPASRGSLTGFWVGRGCFYL